MWGNNELDSDVRYRVHNPIEHIPSLQSPRSPTYRDEMEGTDLENVVNADRLQEGNHLDEAEGRDGAGYQSPVHSLLWEAMHHAGVSCTPYYYYTGGLYHIFPASFPSFLRASVNLSPKQT